MVDHVYGFGEKDGGGNNDNESIGLRSSYSAV